MSNHMSRQVAEATTVPLSSPISTAGAVNVTMQVDPTASCTATVKLHGSIDGVTWFPLGTGISWAGTHEAKTETVTGWAYPMARITTTSGDALTVNAWISANG